MVMFTKRKYRLEIETFEDPAKIIEYLESRFGEMEAAIYDEGAAEPDPRCPLCGRQYDHKYQVNTSSGIDPMFASDVFVCERHTVSGARTYYVHH